MAKATATFDANDSPLAAAFRRIDKNLLGLEKKFAVVAKSAAMMLALPVAGAAALALGVKGVLDTAGGLKDLSAQTGVAAGDLAVLQQAFKNAGKEAEDVGPVINKMQKALATGSGAKTISELGLKMEDLKKQAPIDQFYAIGNAINRVQDPAQKAAAAMDLFGKSGGSLLAVFGDGGLGEAAGQVGEQAGLLSKDAALFDDVSDKLALAGIKVQGFFVGVADQVAPVLKPILDGLANMDFSQAGQQLGTILANLVGAFSDGKIGEILFTSLKIALMNAGNFLIDMFKVEAMAIGQMFMEAFKNSALVFQVLTSADFWKGMGNAWMTMAKAFIGFMMDGIAIMLDKLRNVPGLKFLGGAADSLRETAQGYRSGAGQSRAASLDQFGAIGEKVMGRMGEAIKNVTVAGASQFGTSKVFDTSKEQASLDKVWSGISSNVQAVSAKALADAAGSPTKGEAINFDAGSAKIGVNSLQRIGGGGGVGGGGDPLLSENQRQTGILAKIEQHLSPSRSRGGAFVPVFG